MHPSVRGRTWLHLRQLGWIQGYYDAYQKARGALDSNSSAAGPRECDSWLDGVLKKKNRNIKKSTGKQFKEWADHNTSYELTPTLRGSRDKKPENGSRIGPFGRKRRESVTF